MIEEESSKEKIAKAIGAIAAIVTMTANMVTASTTATANTAVIDEEDYPRRTRRR